jgi:23S rRNA (adenine2503-C2)-methyltransferase
MPLVLISLADLRESLEYWYEKQIKISYEYVVWKDINDNKESLMR